MSIVRFWLLPLITLCAVLSHAIVVQAQWLTLHNSIREDRRYDFTKIACSDTANCTVIGFYYIDGDMPPNRSFIERTTDGGSIWIEQSVPLDPFFETNTGPRLRVAYALDSSNVFVAGDYGIFLKTTDAGQTWVAAHHYDTSLNALSVSAFDDKTILIGGHSGKLKYTTDGGESWQDRQLPSSSLGATKMFSLAEWDVCALDDAILYRTNNAGVSWDTLIIMKDYSGSGTGVKFLRDLTHINRDVIIAVGGTKIPDAPIHSLILRSIDGGESWDTVMNELTVNRRELIDVTFADSVTVYAGGGGKWLLFSSDRGVSWNFDTITDAQNWTYVRSIAAPVRNKILLAGAYGFYSHLLMREGTPGTASVERFGAGESISVYPNPTRNEIAVNFSAASPASHVSVVDFLGRVCASKVLTSGQRDVKLDILHLPQGIFYVRIGNRTRRIVKLQ